MAKLPFIDETLLAQTYPVIFHYTCEKNLDSILRTGGLYATNFQHTNDPEELRATRNALVAAMVQAVVPLMRFARDVGTLKGLTDDRLLEVAQHDAAKFFDVGIRSIPTPPHIACFAAHIREHHKENGLLTLWRLYGQQDGIALGFDTTKLVKITEAIMQSEAIDTIYLVALPIHIVPLRVENFSKPCAGVRADGAITDIIDTERSLRLEKAPRVPPP
jgi:hypothetical protein